MKVKFYVIREDASMFQCFITNNLMTDEKYLLGNKSSRILPPNSKTVQVTGIAFHSFLNELNCCDNFHNNAAINLKKQKMPFVIQIVPIKKEYIDYIWGEIVRTLIWEDLELDYMFSWFSTLGGAFSALGDYKGSAADTAGKISVWFISKLSKNFLLIFSILVASNAYCCPSWESSHSCPLQALPQHITYPKRTIQNSSTHN